MCPKDADGMANSVDPDQTALSGTVWSGSTLFAQTHLSENLGTVQFNVFLTNTKRKKKHIIFKMLYFLRLWRNSTIDCFS